MKYLRYVLYSKDWGVYLGKLLGMGFWSKLDPVGQTYAPTDTCIRKWEIEMDSWDNKPDSYTFVVVMCEEPLYASMQECVEAGLPAWNPDEVLND